jgi:N-acetylneuraminic acid mutarotase
VGYMSLPPDPSRASNESMNQCLVVGGFAVDRRQAVTWCYRDGWKLAGAMMYERGSFGLCVLSGEVYVCGGTLSSTDCISSSVEKYTVATNTWSEQKSLPVARSAHGCCALGDAMYVLGGIGATNDHRRVITNSVYRFDRVSGDWREMAPMPVALLNPGVCVLGQWIFVLGGMKKHESGDFECMNTLYRYDSESDKWTDALAPMPSTAVQAMGLCEWGGKLYAVGGNCMSAYVNTLSVYDPVADMWSNLAPMPTARAWCGVSVQLRTGHLYVVGGTINDTLEACAAVEYYDPATNKWTSCEELPVATTSLRCCCMESMVQLVVG